MARHYSTKGFFRQMPMRYLPGIFMKKICSRIWTSQP